jgi:hypothetical protein
MTADEVADCPGCGGKVLSFGDLLFCKELGCDWQAPTETYVKSLMGYEAKAAGTCKQGERSDLTGCTPASGEPGEKNPGGADDGGERKPSSAATEPRDLPTQEFTYRKTTFKGPDFKKIQAVQDVLSGVKTHVLKDSSTDTMLTEVMKEAGRAEKPTVLDKTGIDELIQKGWTECYRGLTSEDFATQFRSGDMWNGVGIYGNGTYAAAVGHGPNEEVKVARDTAADYGKVIMRMALPPTAKVTTYTEMQSDMVDYRNLINDEYRERKLDWPTYNKLMEVASNEGRWAAMCNYDAIIGGKSGYLVILNRSILAVQDTND